MLTKAEAILLWLLCSAVSLFFLCVLSTQRLERAWAEGYDRSEKFLIDSAILLCELRDDEDSQIELIGVMLSALKGMEIKAS